MGVARPASIVDEVSGVKGFDELSERERDNAVAVLGADSLWVLLEGSQIKQDEFIVGLATLSGASLEGLGVSLKSRPATKKEERKAPAAKEDPPEPATNEGGADVKEETEAKKEKAPKADKSKPKED